MKHLVLFSLIVTVFLSACDSDHKDKHTLQKPVDNPAGDIAIKFEKDTVVYRGKWTRINPTPNRDKAKGSIVMQLNIFEGDYYVGFIKGTVMGYTGIPAFLQMPYGEMKFKNRYVNPTGFQGTVVLKDVTEQKYYAGTMNLEVCNIITDSICTKITVKFEAKL